MFKVELDKSFYPISIRKVYKFLGIAIWQKVYILQHKSNGIFIWTTESGEALTE